MCAFLLPNPADREDAAQEIFIKAYRSLDRFRGDASFFTWLYRIATRHCLDLLRSLSRRPNESWEDLVDREGDRLSRLVSGVDNPAEGQDAADLVGRVLSHLPPDYRAVLVMREMEGLSYREMAGVFDCSEESIRARLQRARKHFREMTRHFLKDKSV